MENKTFICFISHSLAKIKDLFVEISNQKTVISRVRETNSCQNINTI